MKCLKNGISVKFPTRRTGHQQFTESQGGLNRSMQHWLEVYRPGFESPRFF